VAGAIGTARLLAAGTLAWKAFSQNLTNLLTLWRPGGTSVLAPATTLSIYHGHMYVQNVGWSCDGKRIASAGDTLQVWDAATGKRDLLLHVGPYPYIAISALAWSPDGRTLAAVVTALDSGRVQIRLWAAKPSLSIMLHRPM